MSYLIIHIVHINIIKIHNKRNGGASLFNCGESLVLPAKCINM